MITILGILVTIFSFIGGNYFLNRLFENCENWKIAGTLFSLSIVGALITTISLYM